MTRHASWVPNNDGIALSLSVHRAPKYHLRNGKLWLHWSGLMLTAERSQAWSGTIPQARACRRKFDAAAGCKLTPQSDPIPMQEQA